MKFLKVCSFVLAMALVMFSSCSRKKKNIAAGYIPSNASAVLAISPNQLMNKLSKEGVNYQKISNMIFGGMGDTTATAGVFWPGAATSGIDFEQPIYVSLSIPSKITEKNAIIRVILSLKDAKLFTKTLSSQEPEIKKEDKLTFAVLDEAAFGYNDKTAIYVAHLNAEAITGVKSASNFFNDSAVNNEELSSFSGKKAAELVRESFNLDRKNSLASNESFDEMPLDKNDMKLWLNYTDGVAIMLQDDAATAATILEPLMKNSYTSALLNFENGKIKGQSKMYFQKEAAEAIKKSAVRDIDLSLASTFPGTELNGFAGFAFDPSMIRHIIEFVKWDGNVNLALSLIGLKMDDLISCFTGDIVLLFSDAQASQFNGLSPVKMLEKANWAAVAKLNNKAALEKILSSPKVGETIKKEGDAFVMEKNGTKIYFNVKENQLFAGSNTQLLAQYMAGTAKNNFVAGPLARFSKKPMGIYIASGNANAGAGGTKTVSEIIMGTVREMVVTGGRFEKNYLQADVEINMANKDQNSLAAVFKSAFTYMQEQMNAMLQAAGEEDMPPLVPMQVK